MPRYAASLGEPEGDTAVSDDEHELAQLSVRACRTQTARLVSWAERFVSRTWEIEGADGLGYLPSQQLVAAGDASSMCRDVGGADACARYRSLELE